MAQDSKELYKYIPQNRIDELTAIYDDYLYIAREHEKLLQKVSIEDLAYAQMIRMHPDSAAFAWQEYPLTAQEKREFLDFINDDVSTDENRAYVILNHIKPDENNGYSKNFAIPPYTLTSVNVQLPSSIERITVIYPPDAKIGNTTFYIDGFYKANYTEPKAKDMSMGDFIYDQDMLMELGIMINLTDVFRRNGYNIKEYSFRRSSLSVYAAESVATNENVILELLGSFAEKLLVVCRDIYHLNDTHATFKRAQSEGLILSTEDFQDYVNIRNFMRHQWDTLEELGFFSAAKSEKNQTVRDVFVKSYLKHFDKTLMYRMKSYIDALHQMQQVIRKLNPNRIIREPGESNTKFVSRVRAVYQKKLDKYPSVELNQPLASDKYASLNKNLRKLVPNVDISDEFETSHGQHIRIDDYNNRSQFLQIFHATECMVMRHCVTRGFNLRSHEAWEYMANLGVISGQEYTTWQKYAHLRNLLSHNHFNANLRAQLFAVEAKFLNDAQYLMNKIVKAGPDVKKIEKSVYEYRHNDGLIVRLDYNNHRIINVSRLSEPVPEIKATERRIIKPSGHEKFPNGMEFDVQNCKITNVKLPNGININLESQTINWDKQTSWTVNDDGIILLQTEKSRVSINPDLRVTEYMERNRRLPIGRGDSVRVDNRHNMVLDSACRIKEFKFKNSDNAILRTEFMHTRDGKNIIRFADGTTITQFGKTMTIIYNGITLNYDNLNDFAMAYSIPNTPSPTQIITKNQNR